MPVFCSFQTDFWIAGVAPFGEYLVLLAFVEEEDEHTKVYI